MPCFCETREQLRVVPAHVAEEMQRARKAPDIVVQQPGGHLFDQRHNDGVFPVWVLKQPEHSLEVWVDVWKKEKENCASYAVELWCGTRFCQPCVRAGSLSDVLGAPAVGRARMSPRTTQVRRRWRCWRGAGNLQVRVRL
jgi:hypothetical protein